MVERTCCGFASLVHVIVLTEVVLTSWSMLKLGRDSRHVKTCGRVSEIANGRTSIDGRGSWIHRLVRALSGTAG